MGACLSARVYVDAMMRNVLSKVCACACVRVGVRLCLCIVCVRESEFVSESKTECLYVHRPWTQCQRCVCARICVCVPLRNEPEMNEKSLCWDLAMHKKEGPSVHGASCLFLAVSRVNCSSRCRPDTNLVFPRHTAMRPCRMARARAQGW